MDNLSTTQTQPAALDLGRLRDMVGDDEALIDDLLRSFAESNAENIESLAAAIQSGNAPAVRQAAHSLRGASANFGAARMNEISAALEKNARDNILAGAPGMLAQLRECQRALAAFVSARHARSGTHVAGVPG